MNKRGNMAPGIFSSYRKMGCQGADNLPRTKSQGGGQVLPGTAGTSAPARKGWLGGKRDTANKATDVWSSKRVWSMQRGSC